MTVRRGGTGNGKATLIAVGPCRELKVGGRLLRLRGYHAYATPDGKKLVIAKGTPEFGAALHDVGLGDHVTYEGPRYSKTKTPGGRKTWWEHRFGPGVRVRATRSRKTYVVSGGNFRVDNWLRG